MKKFSLVKILMFSLVSALVLGVATPAKAFYLEVPQAFKNLVQSLKFSSAVAQVAPMMGDISGSGYNTGGPVAAPGGGGTGAPGSGGQQCAPGTQCGDQGMMGSDSNYQNYQPNQGGQPGQFGPGPGDNQGGQGMMGPQGGQQGGPSAAEMARRLKDWQRGNKQMERQLKQFETMIANAEKKGTVIPEEAKAKMAQLRAILDKANAVTTAEEMQDIDLSEAGDIMQSLDQVRQDVIGGAQRMDNVRKGMRGMEQGLSMFEKQLAKLTKQNIVVPSEISENLAKIKAIVAAVKAAKTWDEMQAAGFEDLQDLMQNLDQSRQQLEMLSRWPQTLKQMDQQLKRLTSELKKTKTTADRLTKKGIDVSSVYSDFVTAVDKLKAVRDDADSKIKSGDSEGAFDLVENNFFGQMEDVMQNQNIIMMMSNFGSFTSSFKQGIAQSQRTINVLQKKKIDISELQDLLNEAKAKGAEVTAMFKAKPIDPDSIVAAMDEMQSNKQEFEDKVAELTGQESAQQMPWEQGPQQFQQINMGNLQQYMPMQQQGGGGPGGPGGGPGGMAP